MRLNDFAPAIGPNGPGVDSHVRAGFLGFAGGFFRRSAGEEKPRRE